jgi:hypothetical protein
MKNERTSYEEFFSCQILSDFYSPDRHADSAMDTADKFRDDEWRVSDDATYAEYTRSDLYGLGVGNKELTQFIIDVINCMRYNVSMVMD